MGGGGAVYGKLAPELMNKEVLLSHTEYHNTSTKIKFITLK